MAKYEKSDGMSEMVKLSKQLQSELMKAKSQFDIMMKLAISLDKSMKQVRINTEDSYPGTRLRLSSIIRSISQIHGFLNRIPVNIETYIRIDQEENELRRQSKATFE
jgi:hypothetical protein